MNRILVSLSATMLLSAAASAQCFETQFGALLGTGDDALLALQPMNITFPMGGVAASYTHIHVSTNGFAYLTNGAASGGSSTAYSSSAATMVTNLRGLAGQPPRIAPYWRDINILPANSGGVYFNNTIPGKCVVTWLNAVHFGQTTPIFTVQAQLFANGEVRFFYNGTTQNTAICPIAGISQGNLVADPGASNLSVATTGVSTSKIVYQTFATLNTFNLQTKVIAFVPNAGGGYDTTPSPCVPAASTNYGAGCYNVSATWYESFVPSAFDLTNTSIRMTPNGSGGYTVTPGAPSFFLHSLPGLALIDDSVATVALPSAFPYPGGSTSSLSVCSNGFIWMQSPNGTTDYTPSAAELFSSPARLCPAWCDLLPDGAANLANVFAEHDVANNKFYVTWLNVATYTVPGTVTMQVELDLANGNVEYRYLTCTIPSDTLTGWTPGTGFSVVDIGSRDVSASIGLGFATSSSELRGLSLAVAPAPVLGTPITYTTSNIPATTLFNLQVISYGEQTPGLDLLPIGAPGCQLLVAFNGPYFAFPTAGSPTTNVVVNLPNDSNLVGLVLFGQDFSFDAGSNPGGVITSNGTRSALNSF